MTRLERLVRLMIITCPLLAAQNVTVEPGTWSERGIELTAYTSPTFGVKLAATAPASPRFDATPLLPFSFFLTNNTGRKIVMYSVLWTVTYPSGSAVRHHRLIGSLKSPNGNLSIPRGAERLVTIVNGAVSPVVDNPLTDSIAIERAQAAIPNALKMFPSNGSVTVTLEAVVLDDGLALGPDSAHAISRVQAQVKAEKTLASDILTTFQSGGEQAVLDLLTGIVNRSFGPNTISVLEASRMSSDSEAYAAFVEDYRNTMARHYLGVAKSNPALLIKLANVKASETGLTVHR